MNQIEIKEVTEKSLHKFLNYLKDHLKENGDNNLYFLPLTRDQSAYNPNWEKKFKEGLKSSFGDRAWRKLWVALNKHNDIVGHIDIRSRNELNTQHRVLLGMGTHRQYRKQRIGQQLLKHVIKYALIKNEISWIDLEVMAKNISAIRLYEKLNFQLIGTTKDMFRFENESYDYKAMTLNVD